ncbi:MAG: hypothetical protein KAJ19_18735, partial [Gammaproteobacteria bacterium]|nr:hypothetical protein [Gammaproteobacteria bacterium]
YIFRPDPITSYIAYRLSRSWEDVLGSEEFFDIENDPQENKNLINESSENILEEIDKCRKYLRKTNEDIIGFHVETLRDNFRVNNLKNNLFGGRQKGRILCIQSTSNIVFETIVRVLMAELQEWDIDIMVKNSDAQFLPDVKEKIIYAFDGVYQKDKFVSLIDSKAHGYYDCIINTSNVPMGDYAGVYDERYYPVGDLKSSTEIISFLNPCIKAILCLDMTYKKIYPFNIERFLEVISLKKAIKIIRFLLRKLRPLLRKLNAPLNSKNVKINRGFAERIITSKD